MRAKIEIKDYQLPNNQNINPRFAFPNRSIGLSEKSPVFEILEKEGCESFISYIEWLGLTNDQEYTCPPVLKPLLLRFRGDEECKNFNKS